MDKVELNAFIEKFFNRSDVAKLKNFNSSIPVVGYLYYDFFSPPGNRSVNGWRDFTVNEVIYPITDSFVEKVDGIFKIRQSPEKFYPIDKIDLIVIEYDKNKEIHLLTSNLKCFADEFLLNKLFFGLGIDRYKVNFLHNESYSKSVPPPSIEDRSPEYRAEHEKRSNRLKHLMFQKGYWGIEDIREWESRHEGKDYLEEYPEFKQYFK